MIGEENNWSPTDWEKDKTMAGNTPTTTSPNSTLQELSESVVSSVESLDRKLDELCYVLGYDLPPAADEEASDERAPIYRNVSKSKRALNELNSRLADLVEWSGGPNTR